MQLVTEVVPDSDTLETAGDSQRDWLVFPRRAVIKADTVHATSQSKAVFLVGSNAAKC